MTEDCSTKDPQVDDLPLESVSLDDNNPSQADDQETKVSDNAKEAERAETVKTDLDLDQQENSKEELRQSDKAMESIDTDTVENGIERAASSAPVEDSSAEITSAQTQTDDRKRPAPLQTENAEDKPLPDVPKNHQNMADYMTPPTPGLPPTFDPKYRKALEEESDSRTNTFIPTNINFKDVKANTLSPREQEAADEKMIEGINALFNNKFSVAKGIFEAHAREDPLYSLGLGAMAFIKAITSSNPLDADAAISTLTETYQFAHAQIDAASAKKPLKDTVSHYITNLMGTNTTRLPTNTRPLNQEELKNQPEFMPNGALRAHVIKAECGLLMAIVHLTQETVIGYLKTGLNLRRAYSAYSLVWQEYKRMGQDFHKHIDQDTVSAIQFGIGSVHLLLSSLPPKILKIVSAFGWNADKHLGFALLKLCLEGKRIRSPLASMMLLSYYVILTSHAPLILDQELVQPAVECLLEAQKTYPSSAFFLYFAGRVSRLTRSIPLSSQSFKYTQEVSQGDWAEVTMGLLADYEIAFNSAMQLDWKGAADKLAKLEPSHSKPALIKYFYGCCMEILGDRSDAILAFVEASKLVNGGSQVEQFVSERVAFFEQSGYQDLDLSLPALEILLLWNLLASMTDECLANALELVDATLDKIYQREKQEYEIRTIQIAPDTPPPDYYDQRATLLLVKSSILNALGRSHESIIHLNWILDNRSRIHTKWVVPFSYWESGVTCWRTQDFSRARSLWESALSFSNYPFEYRLAIRLNLVITHANDLGVESASVSKPEKGRSTQGRKRMSLLSNRNTASPPDSPPPTESGCSSPV